MIFYHNFLITGGSGSIQLKASMEEYDQPDVLDEQTTAFDVQNNKTYEAIIEVDVSGWGSCNPGFTHSMVFSSPSASSTSQVDLYSFLDTDTNWFECASNYAISKMKIQLYSTNIDGPVAGAWTGSSGFGEIDFQVSSDGTAIKEVKLNFIDFSCGNVFSTSGSITFSNNPGWPITEDEFTIELTLSHSLDQEMQIRGNFEDGGEKRSELSSHPYPGTGHPQRALDPDPAVSIQRNLVPRRRWSTFFSAGGNGEDSRNPNRAGPPPYV